MNRSDYLYRYKKIKMPVSWKLFRVICFLQMLLTVFIAIISLINLFKYGGFIFLFHCFAFVLMTCLSVLAINLLNNNYPDKPVAGKQKSAFNWLYLLNFLLLAFIFGLIFSEYRDLNKISFLWGGSVFSMPFSLLEGLYSYSLVLIFQFVILYGLYNLRRELYLNFFRNKQFEFEND